MAFPKRQRSLTERAIDLRKSMTPQERHLWYDFLRQYPVRFYRQRVIGSYIVDFYCVRARLAIELDGSQHIEDAGLASDAERDSVLSSAGIAVLRFSNADVNGKFPSVCAAIDMEVKRRLKV